MRAGFVTSRQITALCREARQAGRIPEVQIGSVLVRFEPYDFSPPPAPVAEPQPSTRYELTMRERDRLEYLARHEGKRLPVGGIRDLGPRMIRHLLSHGVVEVDAADAPTEVWISAAGLDVLRRPPR